MVTVSGNPNPTNPTVVNLSTYSAYAVIELIDKYSLVSMTDIVLKLHRCVLQQWDLPLKRYVYFYACQHRRRWRSCTYPKRKTTNSQRKMPNYTMYKHNLWLQSSRLSSMICDCSACWVRRTRSLRGSRLILPVLSISISEFSVH